MKKNIDPEKKQVIFLLYKNCCDTRLPLLFSLEIG